MRERWSDKPRCGNGASLYPLSPMSVSTAYMSLSASQNTQEEKAALKQCRAAAYMRAAIFDDGGRFTLQLTVRAVSIRRHGALT